jgi:peroxiredoxin
MLRNFVLLVLLLAIASLSCRRSDPTTSTDKIVGNTAVMPDMFTFEFLDSTGKTVDLRKYQNHKNVVLVFTRGYPGYLCPYCNAQATRLSKNYADFQKRDAEVLMVFPGPTEHVEEFIRKAAESAESDKLPFPILLDKDFQAVDKLHIRSDLAKPSTYILDKEGKIRYAYVGATRTDRPSIDELLKQLDAINGR